MREFLSQVLWHGGRDEPLLLLVGALANPSIAWKYIDQWEDFCRRFYDMAAETSGDAKVPVALALAKLAVVFAWKNAEELKLIVGETIFSFSFVARKF